LSVETKNLDAVRYCASEICDWFNSNIKEGEIVFNREELQNCKSKIEKYKAALKRGGRTKSWTIFQQIKHLSITCVPWGCYHSEILLLFYNYTIVCIGLYGPETRLTIGIYFMYAFPILPAVYA
jgi:hypothetical protein